MLRRLISETSHSRQFEYVRVMSGQRAISEMPGRPVEGIGQHVSADGDQD
jgi:hypothetical protein